MAILHLFRGVPGSGKSTAAGRMFLGVVKFENDQFCMRDGKYDWNRDRVKDSIAWCIKMVETALENGMDVCVCNTFTKRRYIEAYRKIAERYGADFDVYRCDGHFKNVHGLSDGMVENFRNAMEDWPGEIAVKTGSDTANG